MFFLNSRNPGNCNYFEITVIEVLAYYQVLYNVPAYYTVILVILGTGPGPGRTGEEIVIN